MKFKSIYEGKSDGKELPNCNLSLIGAGLDVNGNRIVKLKFPNVNGFSIQTNDVQLQKTQRIIRNLKTAKDMVKLSDADLLNIEKEVTEYIKEFGSKKQKGKLKIYK